MIPQRKINEARVKEVKFEIKEIVERIKNEISAKEWFETAELDYGSA